MSLISPQRPVAQVTSRRHPLAFAVYLLVLVMGLIFVFHWFGVHAAQHALFPHVPGWVILMWKWEMVSGGFGASGALLTRPRLSPHWPDIADLLHIEAIGALVCAFGLTTYATAITNLVGFQKAAPSLSLYTLLIGGLVFRGIQAFAEARRLERLAVALVVEEDRP